MKSHGPTVDLGNANQKIADCAKRRSRRGTELHVEFGQFFRVTLFLTKVAQAQATA